MSKFRKKLSRGNSKSMFARNADKTHSRNLPRMMPMRGGIRM